MARSGCFETKKYTGAISVKILTSLTTIAMISLTNACTSVAKETRIASQLHAREFNSIASQYIERPTFLSLQTYSDGRTALVIDMDEYGVGPAGFEMAGDYALRLDPAQVDAYVALIDKYLEWETLASSRGDMLDKEIGRAPAAGAQSPGEARFAIYSGNVGAHYLSTQFCGVGTCINDMFFSRGDANELKRVLLALKSGNVGHLNVDGVYK